jgi:type IV secretion system protein VirB10
MHGAPKKDETVKLQQADIEQTEPYKPISIATAAPPAPPKLTPPPQGAPPPPSFNLGLGSNPPPAQKDVIPTTPTMITFPVPKSDPPKTVADKGPPETKVVFKPSEIPGLKAGPAMDLTYVLLPGLIFCELDNAIDSTVPGDLQCHLPAPVYSQANSLLNCGLCGVTLMEAETHIYGKYKPMEQGGGARLSVMSTYAITPNGVPVPLDGQGWADALGRAGMAGGVDYHYLERFGGATLLDLSQSALQIAQAEVSKSGSTYVSLGSTNGLASQILQSTINMPPTFRKNMGDLVAIWLHSPVDFSSSYRIRRVGDQ